MLSSSCRRGTTSSACRTDQAVLCVRVRKPDVGDENGAGVESSRRDDDADLAPVERHGGVRANRCARDLTGRRVHTRGKVDCKNVCARVVHSLDQRRRLGARHAGEPGPEQRVEDHVRLPEVGLARRRVDDAHLPARRLELARGDPPVAAVRATAADDRPALRRRERARARHAPSACPHAPSARARSPGSPGIRASAARISSAVYSGSSSGIGDDGNRLRELPRVRHRQVDLARADALRPGGDAPRQPHRRLRPPTISMSFHANARATPNPSALPTASLPAKRPA